MQTNELIHETSPYLLQHAHQPVNWYPWSERAFEKAQSEDKPVFLSIGYSTCHWCHVMAHESFDDEEIARILNENFVAIKVDREERPDIDNVYMTFCQAITGSGGWPMSVFLTPDKMPFYAGTYFPKDSTRRMPGFRQLLNAISHKWEHDRQSLLSSSDELFAFMSRKRNAKTVKSTDALIEHAMKQFNAVFDDEYGGFGAAPKFPTPHNLLFLFSCYKKNADKNALNMAEVTLRHMYYGGLFDHIGFGFSRYSTDREYLIPHFEKMLYDNALLIMAYCSAFDKTADKFYLGIAEKTADYVLRELRGPDGGFYSAQDADSDGEEGLYYALTPEEVIAAIGEEKGKAFNQCFGITEHGNFNGRSIPHLTGNVEDADSFTDCLHALRKMRKQRHRLHLDDKVLTSWNGLMVAAFSQLARITGSPSYLRAAEDGLRFIQTNSEENYTLYVSFRDGKRSGKGFLDDYACMIFALLNQQQATQDSQYLEHAEKLCERVMSDFFDSENGGFYLSGTENEALILQPKESYDGAIPSGNSIMAWNLVRLSQLTDNPRWKGAAKRQLDFMSGRASDHPMSHSFFLLALSDHLSPPPHITVALSEDDSAAAIIKTLPLDAVIDIRSADDSQYPLKGGKTTYYICTDGACLPPSNDLSALRRKEG